MMARQKVYEPTKDGGLILHGLNGDWYRIEPDEADDYGEYTKEMLNQLDLYEPDPAQAQVVIDYLRSLARMEALANKDCPYPGQRMLAPNTHIYRRK